MRLVFRMRARFLLLVFLVSDPLPFLPPPPTAHSSAPGAADCSCLRLWNGSPSLTPASCSLLHASCLTSIMPRPPLPPTPLGAAAVPSLCTAKVVVEVRGGRGEAWWVGRGRGLAPADGSSQSASRVAVCLIFAPPRTPRRSGRDDVHDMAQGIF